ncbi:peptidyl-prolyl cis-trans isomerase FKBP4-like [Cotesia glomerata]|nr:peptidyl-prolyl cis-trans isomerase FKBP4-like [Cotesia glomerata]XP_044588347.1 peptidyl-prolyl cis-trans isomerase FKBP4-like [Cotesia glomerata]
MKTNYISSDKIVEKEVLTHGSITNKPEEKSICHLKISDIKIPEHLNVELNSSLLEPGEKILVIGKADSEVDRQIERAVRWMGEGETSLVRINLPCPLAVELKITLVNHEKFKPIWDWTPEEKFIVAAQYKERGLKLMQENRVKDAFVCFSKAVSLIITLEPISDLQLPLELERKIDRLRTSLYNNMAMCQLKHENFEHAISLCSKVLARDKNNVRAMYRRGCAFAGVKNIESALFDFQRAAHIEPSNGLVWKKMVTYSKLWEEATKKSDNLLKKMFKI